MTRGFIVSSEDLSGEEFMGTEPEKSPEVSEKYGKYFHATTGRSELGKCRWKLGTAPKENYGKIIARLRGRCEIAATSADAHRKCIEIKSED